MSHRLLFLCTMNVCRSPLMALTFAEAIAAADDWDDWTVTSQGTAVVRPESICDVSASLLSDSEAGASFASSHISSPIAVAQLASQDLILVASRTERSVVAQLLPALRARTFTVREAIALGRPTITTADLELLERSRVSNQEVRLGGYPQLLHQRRGTVPMSLPRRRLPFSTNRLVDPIDIPDAHHEKLRQHVAILKGTKDDVRTLYGQISEFLKARAAVA